MSLALMLSRSIITYTLFRSTRAVAKAGYDAIDNHVSAGKASRCLRCGNIEENTEECIRCGSKQMFKMYKSYEDESPYDKDRRRR